MNTISADVVIYMIRSLSVASAALDSGVTPRTIGQAIGVMDSVRGILLRESCMPITVETVETVEDK